MRGLHARDGEAADAGGGARPAAGGIRRRSSLEDCRADLTMAAIQGGAPRARSRPRKGRGRSSWKRWARPSRDSTRCRQPVGAVALLAVGLLRGALHRALLPPQFPQFHRRSRPTMCLPPCAPCSPIAPGGVQIAFDETRHRVVSGSDGRSEYPAAAAGRRPRRQPRRTRRIDGPAEGTSAGCHAKSATPC